MVLIIVLFVLILAALRHYLNKHRQQGTLAFFHPYCEGGGGGERVLFQAIDTLIKEKSQHTFKRIIIYGRKTDSTLTDILKNVQKRFQIDLLNDAKASNEVKIELVQLDTVWALNPKNYPRFTLLLQSLAEMIVGFEALYRLVPETFIDTTGCPFTLPVFRWIGGAQVACYVHYPTITTQMFSRVSSRQSMYNNADFIAKNSILTTGKLLYYYAFSWCYRFCGYAAKVVMTNGSWTTDQIRKLWPGEPIMVYPPVDVHLYESGRKAHNSGETSTILSVGQIRPEKNHRLQLEVLKLLKDSKANVKLVIAGGCRNEEDNQRLESLKKYANDLDIGKDVEWKINVTNEELRYLNNTALIGIHTMIEEHFGIAVVESMAAGCIMIGHNSGGPKLDIIKHGVTGYLATEAEEYASCVKTILESSDEQLNEIRKNAVKHIEIFSVKNFSTNFMKALSKL